MNATIGCYVLEGL